MICAWNLGRKREEAKGDESTETKLDTQSQLCPYICTLFLFICLMFLHDCMLFLHVCVLSLCRMLTGNKKSNASCVMLKKSSKRSWRTQQHEKLQNRTELDHVLQKQHSREQQQRQRHEHLQQQKRIEGKQQQRQE